MWVEKVVLESYGGIQDETVVFSQDKLNLVVEPNEYGKTTMATAIWSILFDFPPLRPEAQGISLSDKDARRPKSDIFKAALDITTKERRLTIERDFSREDERGVSPFKVLDRDKGNKDVTKEFTGKNGEDEVGLKLTGMTRELFKSTCFVGQRELDEHAFGGENNLASLVQGIADSASPSGTSAAAVRVLSEALDRIPINDRRVKVDNLVRDLEMVRQDLLGKIRACERDRRDVSASFDRLMIINRVLSGDNNRYKATEYQNLKFQLSDAESRLTRLRELTKRKTELESKLGEGPSIEEFPADLRRPIKDLWERKSNKSAELAKLKEELDPTQQSFQKKRDELKEKLGDLSNFSQEEASIVSALAGSLRTTEEELFSLQDRRDKQKSEFKEETGSDNVDDVRTSLASMEAEGIEHARNYNSLITVFQDQLTAAETTLHASRAKHKELAVKRDEEKKKRQLLSFVFGFIAVLCIVFAVMLWITNVQSAPVFGIPLIVVGVIMLGVAAFYITPVFKPEMLFKGDFVSTENDINRITSDMSNLQNKVAALEVKLDTMARKVGLVGRSDLLNKLDEYGKHSGKLKELTMLESLVEQKQQALERYRGDIKRFLVKSGRSDADLTAQSASELSQSLSLYFDESRALEQSNQEAAASMKKVTVLEEEIIDTDLAIINLMAKVGVTIEEGDKEMIDATMQDIAAYARILQCDNELKEIEKETGSFQELPSLLKNLEDYQQRVIQQIDSLKSLYPGIENLQPLTPEELANEEDAPKDMKELEALKTEREDLLVRVRSLSNTCDEQYLSCLEELDLTEFRLQSAKRAKIALELARDTLKRLSGENYIDWSTQLNNVAREMLDKIGIDYEEIRFDNELRLVARRKNEEEVLSSAHIMSQLSTGTKEQLHWLARLVVARYLSRHSSLPIIMDEPFSEADDDRFLKMMRFLISAISKEHQIVLFSCHQQRHLWLRQQLEDSEKGKLVFCRRQKTQVKAATGIDATDSDD